MILAGVKDKWCLDICRLHVLWDSGYSAALAAVSDLLLPRHTLVRRANIRLERHVCKYDHQSHSASVNIPVFSTWVLFSQQQTWPQVMPDISLDHSLQNDSPHFYSVSPPRKNSKGIKRYNKSIHLLPLVDRSLQETDLICHGWHTTMHQASVNLNWNSLWPMDSCREPL